MTLAFGSSGHGCEITQPSPGCAFYWSSVQAGGGKRCPRLLEKFSQPLSEISVGASRARDKNEPYFAPTLCSSRGREEGERDSLLSPFSFSLRDNVSRPGIRSASPVEMYLASPPGGVNFKVAQVFRIMYSTVMVSFPLFKVVTVHTVFG